MRRPFRFAAEQSLGLYNDMTGEEKDTISHRGIALRAFAEELESWLREGVYGTV